MPTDESVTPGDASRPARPGIGWVRLWLLLVIMLPAGGCASGRIEGVVTSGAFADLRVVSAAELERQPQGVSNAMVTLLIDPSRPGSKRVGPVRTDHNGRFSIRTDVVGAGFLEYELGVLVQAEGLSRFYDQIPMPGSGRKLLVVMSDGPDGLRRSPPIDDDIDSMLQQWEFAR